VVPAEACKNEADAVFKSGLSPETCRKITDLMDQVTKAQPTLTDMPSSAEVSDVDATPTATDKANLAQISGLDGPGSAPQRKMLQARRARMLVDTDGMDHAIVAKPSQDCLSNQKTCACKSTGGLFAPLVLSDCVEHIEGPYCVDKPGHCSDLND